MSVRIAMLMLGCGCVSSAVSISCLKLSMAQRSVKSCEIMSGWWYTYPPEKYESQWEGLDYPIYEMESKNMFQTNNQICLGCEILGNPMEKNGVFIVGGICFHLLQSYVLLRSTLPSLDPWPWKSTHQTHGGSIAMGIPQNGWFMKFIMENPNLKWMRTGG